MYKINKIIASILNIELSSEIKAVLWILSISIILLTLLIVNRRSRQILKTGLKKVIPIVALPVKIMFRWVAKIALLVTSMEIAFCIMVIAIAAVWISTGILSMNATHKFSRLNGHALKLTMLISAIVAFTEMLFFINKLGDEVSQSFAQKTDIFREVARRKDPNKEDTKKNN